MAHAHTAWECEAMPTQANQERFKSKSKSAIQYMTKDQYIQPCQNVISLAFKIDRKLCKKQF